MFALMHMELLKLAKRPITWILLILQLSVLGLGTAANLLNLRRADQEMYAYLLQGLILPDSLAMASQFIYLFGSIMLAMLAAASVGSEYNWGTVRQVLATGLSRTRFAGAKLLGLAIIAAIFVVLPICIQIPLSVWVSQTYQQPVLAASVDPSWITALIGRTYLVVIMPMAFAMFIGIVTRSQVVSVGATLGILIADQFIAPLLWSLGTDWALQIVHFFPFWCARSLLGFNFTSMPVELPVTMSQERAVGTLVAYTMICLSGGLLVFRSRDVSGPV
jgi:ABC-2 type transport system permease protein